jgi:hypothetical protein
MNARRKDHLVDMINAIKCLQSEWTDIYQWSLEVRELEVKPLQLNDYEVSIMTGSDDESCRLYLLLNDVTDLNVTMCINPSIVKCR